MIIQVHHKIPVTVETTEVKLPYYFKEKRYSYDHYYAVLEDFTIVHPYYTEGNYVSVYIKRLESAEEVGEFIESFYTNKEVEDTTEQEFREMFNKVNQIITSKL